jgi:hypothetical protein
MDELEFRLEHELSSFSRVPLAEPVPVGELRRRARRVRAGRALTGVVAVATQAAVIAAVVTNLGSGTDAVHPRNLQVAAPSFVLGDIDAVVLSSGFDEDGARSLLPPSVERAVADVPGVQSVSGVIDTFAPVVDDDPGSEYSAPTTPPRTPVLFSYHQDDQLHLVSGRLPVAPDEIAVDADFVSRTGTDVNEQVTLRVQDKPLRLHVVGTFDLPGVDLAGIPLAAMSAGHQLPELYLDRIDVNLAPGAAAANVRTAIAGAIGADYTIVEPSAISFPDQRLAQIEIQHAYWALLSPDTAERETSGVGPSDFKERTNYSKYSELALHVELRVENVTFLSPDAAALTYRIYYGGNPSPIINDPQSGTATRVQGHWQLGKNTLCSLAALVGIACTGVDDVTISPPNGYQPPSTLDPEIRRAFEVLTDVGATVDQRVAALVEGAAVKAVVAAGLKQDQTVGKITFTIAGWRAIGANDVQILYSLQTASGPSTPWPTTASARKLPDGHWYAAQHYACGASGLAGGGCSVPDQGPIPGGGATPTTAVLVTPTSP